MATKKTTDTEAKATAETSVQAKEKVTNPMEEYVEIELFQDDDKYSGDMYVSVNGENCIIQRGVPTKIKRKFYEVIRESMEQDRKTAKEIAKLTTK